VLPLSLLPAFGKCMLMCCRNVTEHVL